MGQIITSTDYNTDCGSVGLTFIQMLASTIVGYHDIAGVLHYRINAVGDSDECTELDDFWTCDTSHIDPEKQLVENTFAVDECGYLAWKVFQTDSDFEDYENCGEIPLTLIELLSRAIVNYEDRSWINAYITVDTCDTVEALLDCNTNNIESERLLVTNIFGVDECDRLLVKFFANESAMTDYHTECNDMPQTFYQLLARCIVKFSGHYYINVAAAGDDCEDLHPFWTCDNNHIDPESALVENVFAIDACGNLALKLFANGAEIRWEGGDT